jgi:hypothetical protein
VSSHHTFPSLCGFGVRERALGGSHPKRASHHPAKRSGSIPTARQPEPRPRQVIGGGHRERCGLGNGLVTGNKRAAWVRLRLFIELDRWRGGRRRTSMTPSDPRVTVAAGEWDHEQMGAGPAPAFGALRTLTASNRADHRSESCGLHLHTGPGGPRLDVEWATSARSSTQ